MKRHATEYLKIWFKRKNRKPLIIRGARQVGKSTLVRLFAEIAGLKLVEINFELMRLKALSKETPDVDGIISEIESKMDVRLSEKTLLFFDEVQQQSQLLPALRYFYELHPEIPVICAGSLLEFVLENHQFSMPVGRVEYFHLSPMTFFEFLLALGKENLLKQIKNESPQIKSFHYEQLNDLVSKFLIIGGMPEAIKIYMETKNLSEVRHIQRTIIKTYQDDFPKYTSLANLPRIDEIFRKIPQVLGKKIKYTEISTDFQTRDIKKILHLLKHARLLHFCYHTNASGTPIKSQIDEHVYKIYFLDIGLLNYMTNTSIEELSHYNNSQILTKGIIAEQFAAQHLAYYKNGVEEPELFYWLRDKKTENAEVDFIFEKNGQIIPIEVKASEAGRIKSLLQFVHEKKIKNAIRLDLKDRSNDPSGIIKKAAFKGSNSELIKFTLHNWHLGLVEICC